MLRGYMKDTGTEDAFVLDPSITRGLDYYTGVVFESFLRGLPGLGSVCSGGRYDNLVGLYSKESFSGVGASIGIDRLIAGLEELGALEERASYAKLAIVCPREEQAGVCQALAGRFRREGIPCEVLPDAAGGAEGKRLVKQFMLAEKKGLRWVIIPGEAPLSGPFTLRNLAQRQNQEGLGLEEIAALVRLSS
jgi:histidyl-tRNA synthetase